MMGKVMIHTPRARRLCPKIASRASSGFPFSEFIRAPKVAPSELEEPALSRAWLLHALAFEQQEEEYDDEEGKEELPSEPHGTDAMEDG